MLFMYVVKSVFYLVCRGLYRSCWIFLHNIRKYLVGLWRHGTNQVPDMVNPFSPYHTSATTRHTNMFVLFKRGHQLRGQWNAVPLSLRLFAMIHLQCTSHGVYTGRPL